MRSEKMSGERMKQVRGHTPGNISSDEGMHMLYHRYATAIFGYVCLRTPSREDAEDILLEIFLHAMESTVFASLSEEKQRAWLYTTARNKIIDRYRKATRREVIALDILATTLYEDDEQAPEQVILRQEEIAQLLTRVKRLPALQQEVLRLRFANDLRCSEIAALLGKPEGSIRSVLSRALNTLRTIYDKHH